MTLQGRRREEADGPGGLRVGFTVTKREGHATERNRIRRRLRRAVLDASLGLRDVALDLVVIGRRDAHGAPYEALVDDLARGLVVVMKTPSPGAKSGRRGGPAVQLST